MKKYLLYLSIIIIASYIASAQTITVSILNETEVYGNIGEKYSGILSSSVDIIPSGMEQVWYGFDLCKIEDDSAKVLQNYRSRWLQKANRPNYNYFSVNILDTNSYGVYCIIFFHNIELNNYDCKVDTLYFIINPFIKIYEHPQYVSGCIGGKVELRINAVAMKPGSGLKFSWRRNGQEIDGAKDSIYTINSVTNQHAGAYDCIVETDIDSGRVISKSAALTVKSLPVFLDQTESQTCFEDITFMLMVKCDLKSLEYQWYKDDSPIDGAISESYYIVAPKVTDAGIYTCKVTNECGTITSESMTITYTSKPLITITNQSSDIYADSGSNVQLFVEAHSSNTGDVLIYKWKHNGTSIPTGTESTYSIYNLTSDQKGIYEVSITVAPWSRLVVSNPIHVRITGDSVEDPEIDIENAELFKIYNINGVEVNPNNLCNGLYFHIYKTWNNKYITKKVMIIK